MFTRVLQVDPMAVPSAVQAWTSIQEEGALILRLPSSHKTLWWYFLVCVCFVHLGS